MNRLNFAVIVAAGSALAMSPTHVAAQAPANSVSLGIALMPGEEGPEVAKVFPNRGGEALGLKVGDIVVEAGGMPISPEVLQAYMKQLKPGDQMRFKVKRTGAILELTGKAMATPKNSPAPNLQPVGQPGPAEQPKG